MNDYENIKQSLETILKKGDIFDVISIRENKSLNQYVHAKAMGTLYSRIFLIGVLAVEKIKSKYAPVEEIKQAQDKIRKYLTIPVDIILSKHVVPPVRLK